MNAIDKNAARLSRRSFLAISLSAAGGLMIGGFIPEGARALVVDNQPWDETATGQEINAWIMVEPDDTVIIRVAQPEPAREQHLQAHEHRRLGRRPPFARIPAGGRRQCPHAPDPGRRDPLE